MAFTFDQYLANKNLITTQEEIERILAWSQPIAQTTMMDDAKKHLVDGRLPIKMELVTTQPSADRGRNGHLMPCWFDATQRPVPMYVLDNWAFYMGAWKASVYAQRADIERVNAAMRLEDRLKVAIGNDTVQPFVPDPPAGTYRWHRHHALLLFTGTAWLPEERQREWFWLYDLGARNLCRREGLAGKPDLHAWLEQAERDGRDMMTYGGQQVKDDAGVRAFLADADKWTKYERYLCIAMLGMAALYPQYAKVPSEKRTEWLHHQLFVEHAKADYLKDAISQFVRSCS